MLSTVDSAEMDVVQSMSGKAILSPQLNPASSYETANEAFAADPEFANAFKQRMSENRTISIEMIPEIFATQMLYIDESESTQLAEDLFGDKNVFTLTETVELLKEFQKRREVAIQIKNGDEVLHPVVVETKAVRLWKQVLGYFTLSERSLVSGRKMFAFCVATLLVATGVITVVALTVEMKLVRSQYESRLAAYMDTLSGVLETTDQYFRQDSYRRNKDTARILGASLQFHAEQTTKEELSTLLALSVASDVHNAQLRDFYNEQMQREMEIYTALVSKWVTDPQNVSESALISTLSLSLSLVNPLYVSLFVHCPMRPSSIPRSIIGDELLDKTLAFTSATVPSSTFFNVLPNGTALGDLTSTPFQNCTKRVIFRILPMTHCSIGMVLNATIIWGVLHTASADTVNRVNNNFKEAGINKELVFSRTLNSSAIDIISNMSLCESRTTCSRVQRQVRPAKRFGSNESFETYYGAAAMAAYVYDNITGGMVTSQTTLTTLTAKFDESLVAFVETTQAVMGNNTFEAGTSVSDIASNVTFLSKLNFTNDLIPDIFHWNQSSNQMHTSSHSTRVNGVYVRIFVTVSELQVLKEYESLAIGIVAFYNNLDMDHSEEVIAVLVNEKPPEVLSENHCMTCDIVGSWEIRQATQGRQGGWEGVDYRGANVIGHFGRTQNMALSITKTKIAIDQSIITTLPSVIAPSVAVIVLGFCIMACVMLTINRQVKNLITNRGDMESRLERLDGILENMFPKSVKETMLKQGQIVEIIANVSVAFLDVHNFTPIANVLNAKQLQQLLSYLFHCLDEVATYYGVNKVKTIGDCYLGVCGLKGEVVYNNDPIEAMFLFNLNSLLIFSNLFTHNSNIEEIFRIVEKVLKDTRAKTTCFSLRAGMACGNVLCGVLPGKVPSFDVWGPVINLASRLESSGTPGSLQFSESVFEGLSRTSTYSQVRLEGPRAVYAKGFGKINAYALATTSLEVPKELRTLLQLDFRMGIYNFLKMKETGNESESSSVDNDITSRLKGDGSSKTRESLGGAD